jgi:16S rRNA processing protein RimM
MDDLLQVGVITSTHGIKGEVKVYPTTDDVKRFKKLKNVILDDGKEQKEVNIQGVKFFKNMAIVKFEGYDKIEDVERMRQVKLLVTRENAVKCAKNEYFIADLVGCTVFEDKEELGVLTEVLPTGANDVYIVKTKEDKEILIPAIKECILKVDIKKKKIKVHLLDGLVD